MKFLGFGKKTGKKEKRKKIETPLQEVAKAKPSTSFLALHGKILSDNPQLQEMEAQLKQAVFAQLKLAMATGDVGSREAQILAHLHRKWICCFWKEGMYTKDAHLTLADIYVAEPRFSAFYDVPVGRGATQFLRDSIEIYVFRGGIVSIDPHWMEEKSLPEFLKVYSGSPEERCAIEKKDKEP